MFLAPLFSVFNSNFPFLHRMEFHINASCDFFSEPNFNVQHDDDVEQKKLVSRVVET